MPIEFQCRCGATYCLKDSRAGSDFQCKVCSAALVVPRPAPPAPAAGTAAAEAAPPALTAVSDAQERWKPKSKDPFAGFGEMLHGEAAGREADLSDPAPLHVAPEMPLAAVPSPPPAPAPAAGRASPPSGWWAARGLMAGLCVAFLFLPWFSVTGRRPCTGESETASVSGWDLLRATVQGLAEGAAAGGSGPGAAQCSSLPPGLLTAAAGGILMVVAPCLYAAGIVLACVLACLSGRLRGRGVAWPFVVWAGGMAMFLVGWLVVSHVQPLRGALDALRSAGVDVGVSTWLYASLTATLGMALVARIRPAPVGVSPAPDDAAGARW